MGKIVFHSIRLKLHESEGVRNRIGGNISEIKLSGVLIVS
jgi:hypothetical protein